MLCSLHLCSTLPSQRGLCGSCYLKLHTAQPHTSSCHPFFCSSLFPHSTYLSNHCLLLQDTVHRWALVSLFAKLLWITSWCAWDSRAAQGEKALPLLLVSSCSSVGDDLTFSIIVYWQGKLDKYIPSIINKDLSPGVIIRDLSVIIIPFITQTERVGRGFPEEEVPGRQVSLGLVFQ